MKYGYPIKIKYCKSLQIWELWENPDSVFLYPKLCDAILHKEALKNENRKRYTTWVDNNILNIC